MTTFQINISKKRSWWPRRQHLFSLPDSWEEVEPTKKLKSILLLTRHKGAEAQLRLLRLWLGLKQKTFQRLLLTLTPEALTSILRLTDWVFAPDIFLYIENFHHNELEHTYPGRDFEAGIGVEYPVADEFYTAYLETGEREQLVRLTAALARPEGKPITSRTDALQRAETMQQLPDEVLTASFLYFDHVKKVIHDTFQMLFKNPEEDSEESNVIDFGWWSRYEDIAETTIFGAVEQVQQQNFFTLCMYLVRKKSIADEQEQKMKMQKAKNQIND